MYLNGESTDKAYFFNLLVLLILSKFMDCDIYSFVQYTYIQSNVFTLPYFISTTRLNFNNLNMAVNIL